MFHRYCLRFWKLYQWETFFLYFQNQNTLFTFFKLLNHKLCLTFALLTSIALSGCFGGDDSSNSNENTPEESSSELGTCVHYGEVDGSDSSDPPIYCLKPTGSSWTTTSTDGHSVEDACDDWDFHAIYQSDDDECPTENLIGSCLITNGGQLIGASFDDGGSGYAGSIYYYPDSPNLPAENHCTSQNGTYTEAD